MSSVLVERNDVSMAPAPTTPWKPSKRTQFETFSIVLLSAIVAGVAVLLTGLAGVDGFWAAFVFVTLIVTALRTARLDSNRRKDALIKVVVMVLASLAFIPWMSIFVSVLQKGLHGFRPNFFFETMQTTTPDDELSLGGAGHAIVGSLLMVLIATIITIPLGILSGIYLTEIRGRLTFFVRFIILSISGVPSIVAGLFVYTTFVDYTNSFSGMAGSIALAVLMLPTVARISEEVLKLVPDDLRSASYALGARQWRTSFMIVLPTVRSGLTTAAILGVARVIGETAPLLLTSLSSNSYVLNPLGGPIGSLPTYVFGLLQIGTENALNRAWTGSLVLLILVFALFSIARYTSGKDRR